MNAIGILAINTASYINLISMATRALLHDLAHRNIYQASYLVLSTIFVDR